MSETQPPVIQPGSADLDGPKLVYILYFLSMVIGITAIAGVIVAYLKRGKASAAAASHFTSRYGPSGSGCSSASSAR